MARRRRRATSWPRGSVTRAAPSRISPKSEKQTLDEIAALGGRQRTQSSSGRETTSEEEKEPPKTTHATRRLFRLPNTNDEPHFDFDDEAAPEADRLYLGQLTEGQNFKGAATRRRAKSTPNKRKRHATRNSLPLRFFPRVAWRFRFFGRPSPVPTTTRRSAAARRMTRRRTMTRRRRRKLHQRQRA